MAKAGSRSKAPVPVELPPVPPARKKTAVAGKKPAPAKRGEAVKPQVAAKMAAAKKPSAAKVVAAPAKAVAVKSPAKKAARKSPAARPVDKPAGKAMAGKAPVAKAGTRKAAAKVTPVPVPVAGPRRAAAPVAAARRARALPAPRKAAPPKQAAKKPQAFTVSHLNEADFKPDGLRAYALYRDLGIAAATGGLCQAHVIRMIPPCTDEVRKRHVHTVDLQLVYVLKGWMKNEFEGHGEQMMSAGSCWLQPSGIKHTVLDYSPDLEVLEIIVPADFKTAEA
jgi:hypothetical protein